MKAAADDLGSPAYVGKKERAAAVRAAPAQVARHVRPGGNLRPATCYVCRRPVGHDRFFCAEWTLCRGCASELKTIVDHRGQGELRL